MSGSCSSRADGNGAGQDTEGRSWAELASSNERLVQLPGVAPPRNGTDRVGDARQRSARRGRCDLRQVVTTA